MQRTDSWGRESYPLQSSLRDPVPSTGAREEEDSGPVQLPRNIRATTDSSKYTSKGRTIVVCLDGTGDKFDNDNSNIVNLVGCLKKDDRSQATYYQAGIGTYSDYGLSSGLSAAMDMAVGSGLGLHVRDAYHFLMQTYKEGDKICIFGFSRGAYTARCLAGMIHKVGLLPTRNEQQIQFAYEFYKDDTAMGWKQSLEFKKTFCIDVNIYFLGVFDSVASVGFIPRTLPLSSTPTSKSLYFRHAMALDEHRAKFKVSRFTSKDWEEVVALENGKAKDELIKELKEAATPELPNGFVHKRPKHKRNRSSRHHSNADLLNGDHSDDLEKADPLARFNDGVDFDAPESAYERRTGHAKPFDTDVLEVWFLGAHADVGGGAVANSERHKLAQIPLRWMIRQAFECNTGIIFNTKHLAEVGLDVHTLWPKYRKLEVPVLGPSPSMIDAYEQGLPPLKKRGSKLIPLDEVHKQSGEGLFHLKIDEDEEARRLKEWFPEQVEDYFDAMCPSNDQLAVAKLWWILEVWPVEYKLQHTDSDEWGTKVGMNLGRYRGVEDPEPKIHWTVRQRMQDMGYKINARLGRNAVLKIVS